MHKFFRGLWTIITFPFRLLWKIITAPVRGIRSAAGFMNEDPADNPLSEVLTTAIKKPSVMVVHIEAMRKHLLRMVIALVIGVAICAVFTEQILTFLAVPIGGLSQLQVLDPTESVGVFMKVTLFGGFAIALPWFVFEVWLFFAPGLNRRERRAGLAGIPLALLFFLGGLAFTYWLLFPTAIPFLRDFLGMTANWRLSTYVNFVTGLLFWIGICFEFPLAIYVLTRLHVVKPQGLVRQWRIAVVVIAVLAAAITPTPDPLNMSLVMLPMLMLYFIGIGFSFLAMAGLKETESPAGRKKKKKSSAPAKKKKPARK